MKIIKELTEGWLSAGIEKGDTLLLHSDIKKTVRRYLRKGKKLSPEEILESFIEAVGPSGTILLPLFNFDFTKGIVFDIRDTPSHMGVLTEIGRKHPYAVRTGHPIYSFAAIGYNAEKFQNVDNFSGYGSDSPFDILHRLNGKIAVLDLPDQNSMTFYHYIEEMHEVDYRYHKTFIGNYRGAEGKIDTKKYGLFVRDIEKKVLTHVNPVGELMWRSDIFSGFRPGEGCGLRIAQAKRVYEFVSDIITSDRAEGLLYRIGEG